MKTRKAILKSCIILTLCGLTAVSCRDGQEGHAARRVVLPAGSVHDGWYFAAGDQVVIDGTVNGDVYAAGGIVEVNGTINGDLLIAGGQVHIGGTISDDVRAAGGNVAFSGKIGKNITAAGGTVTLERSADLAGNLLAAAGSIHLAGTVAHDAMVSGGEMSQTGSVGGDLTFAGGSLAVLSGGKVGGNLLAHVRSEANVDTKDAAIGGTTTINEDHKPTPLHIAGLPVWRFFFKLFWMASLLVTGLVFILLRPALFLSIGSTMIQRPGKSILWGLIALVVTPFAIAILFVTVVGVPLGLMLLALYLLALYVTQLTLGIAVAVRIISGDSATRWSAFWPFAVGLIVVQLLMLIPIVGIVLALAGLFFGLGAMVLACTPQGVGKPAGAL